MNGDRGSPSAIMRGVRNGRLSVAIINACTRAGRGGSPTAIVQGRGSGAELREIARTLETSHAVLVAPREDQDGAHVVALRFFTCSEELPACGHGTIAALAFLAQRSGDTDYRARVHAGGICFAGRAEAGPGSDAYFELGDVDLRPARTEELDRVSDALGVSGASLVGTGCVASPGRPRLLLSLSAPEEVSRLHPDFLRLRAACDELGLLGCFAYSPSEEAGRYTARMFAPSIGVAEDVANANSCGCLAALLAGEGIGSISVDMGDSLGRVATVKASVAKTHEGKRIEVGGTASLAGDPG